MPYQKDIKTYLMKSSIIPHMLYNVLSYSTSKSSRCQNTMHDKRESFIKFVSACFSRVRTHLYCLGICSINALLCEKGWQKKKFTAYNTI